MSKITKEQLKELILEEIKKIEEQTPRRKNRPTVEIPALRSVKQGEEMPTNGNPSKVASGQIDTNKKTTTEPSNKTATKDSKDINQKQMLKQNVSKQVKLLKFMKEVLKQSPLPIEISNMAKEFQKANTGDFLNQVLGINGTIPIRISGFLEHPQELMMAIIDEIINSSIRSANQRLAEHKIRLEEIKELDLTEELTEEEEIKHLIDRTPEDRLKKHREKEAKKKHEIPKLDIDPKELSKLKIK